MTTAGNSSASLLARATLAVVLGGGCNQLLGIETHALPGDDAAVTSRDGGSDEPGPGVDTASSDDQRDDESDDEGTAPDGAVGNPCLSIHVDNQTAVNGDGPAHYAVAAWALYLVPSADVQAALFSVWAPLHVYDPAYGVFKSARAHAPPYDHELEAGLEQAGFTNTGCINRAQLTQNSDLILSLVVVPSPDAPIGTSFDLPGTTKVVLGSTLLKGSVYANGSLLGSELTQSFPNPESLYAGAQPPLAGSTHLIANFDLMTFMWPGVKNVPGNYGFVLTIANTGDPSQPSPTQQSVQFTIE